MLLSLFAANKAVYFYHLDVSQAFLWATLADDIYLRPFPGLQVPKGHCLKLHKSLYGLKQASYEWHKLFTKTLHDLGFQQSEYDHCLYTMTCDDGWIITCIFVDDMIVFTNNPYLKAKFLADLNAKFKVEDRGDLSWFLAVGITRNLEGGYVDLCQSTFAFELARDLGYVKGSGRKVESPEIAQQVLSKTQGGIAAEVDDKARAEIENFNYRSFMGRVIYLLTCTRPDILHAAKILGQFVCDPGQPHIAAMRRLGAYIGKTHDQPLRLHGPRNMEDAIIGLVGDSDDANNPDTRRSLNAVFGFIGSITHKPAMFYWHSEWTTWVTSSSCVSEMYVLALMLKIVLEYKPFLESLGFDQDGPTLLHSDSSSAITIMNGSHPARYKGTKHMERRYFALQQAIAARIAQLEHISSENNPADLGATFKTIREFKHLRTLIMGLDFDKNRPTSLTLKAGKAYSSDAIGDGPGITYCARAVRIADEILGDSARPVEATSCPICWSIWTADPNAPVDPEAGPVTCPYHPTWTDDQKESLHDYLIDKINHEEQSESDLKHKSKCYPTVSDGGIRCFNYALNLKLRNIFDMF